MTSLETPLLNPAELDEQLIRTDFALAREIYPLGRPELLGRLVMSQDAASEQQAELSTIYQSVFSTIVEDPRLAQRWARGFGPLNVCVALDNQDTNFRLVPEASFRPPEVSEIRTDQKRSTADNLCMTEQDGPLAFVLANNEEVTEMSLIKALHMVDFALATNQLDGGVVSSADLPLIRLADRDQLLKLRTDAPGVRLRLYGNVRGRDDAPDILGTVVPTAVLEQSGITTESLRTVPSLRAVPEAMTLGERPSRAGFGITTAKRPHIGHGFLLAKAITEAGKDGTVTVELNDQGPRVAEAVAAYAATERISFREAASEINRGVADVVAVENAYRNRAQITSVVPEVLPENFALTANNRFCSELLSSLGAYVELEFVANSAMQRAYRKLGRLPNTQQLFGDSGMSLLQSQDGSAAVIEQEGRPTIAGILAGLSVDRDLTFCDSPKPLDKRAQAVFADAGLNIEFVPGMGVTLGGEVASGTAGQAVRLDRLVQRAEAKGFYPRLVISTLRQMLNEAYFVPGDGDSLNPSFANEERLLQAFDTALEYARFAPVDLFKPMQFVSCKRNAVRNLIQDKLLQTTTAPNKATVGILTTLFESVPELSDDIGLQSFLLANADTPDLAVPKSLRRGTIDSYNKLLSANPDFTIGLLRKIAASDPERAILLLEDTELADIAKGMGYPLDDPTPFLTMLQGVKDVYRLTK